MTAVMRFSGMLNPLTYGLSASCAAVTLLIADAQFSLPNDPP